jgi:alanine dehydrogenase
MGHPSTIQTSLVDALRDLGFEKRKVRFLLGSDEHIPQEARVALVPEHLERLRADLASLGLEVEMVVVSGAGDRAKPAYTDDAYRAAGAKVVTMDETAGLPAFDVVHALKEPTAYEADLRGPFLRMGALHLASKPPGVCALLRSKNFSAIFDGATIGSCSYLVHQGDRTPIVGSMSRFAGSVAAKKAVAAVGEAGLGHGKVVVVGGGIAGRSAARVLTRIAAPLVFIEPQPLMIGILHEFMAGLHFADYQIVPKLTDDTLADAIAVVFAHRSGARAAEKVTTETQIRTMRRGAAISDIAIDQGGSIAHAGYDHRDDAATAREKYIALLGSDFSYYAEVNMPREEPHEASRMHGDASLPYVTTLLALVAHLGSTEAVARHILTRTPRLYTKPEEVVDLSLLDAFVQDLRNGQQLAMVGGKLAIKDADIARDEILAAWLDACAK